MSYIYNFNYSSSFTGDILSGELEVADDLSFDYKKYTSVHYIKEIVKRNTIYPRFRIFILNPDETTKSQISNEDIVLGGSYNENYQNGQRRTLSFSLLNNDGKYTPNINGIWVNTKLLLEIGLKLPETDGILWFNKGVYVVTNASPSHNKDNKTVSVECSDKFAIFESKQGTLESSVEIPVGTDIKSIIRDTLMLSSGNGYPLDSKDFIYHSSFEGRVTPLTISLQSGATYGELLTQLAEILSAEIFYNASGNLTLIPLIDVMQDGDKPVVYDYTDTECSFQDDKFSIDMTQFINKIVVIGSNVNGHTCTASKENNDPSSPLCSQRIGLRISVINDSNITNDILAQERADYELRKVLIAKSTLSSSVFFNPLLSVNNLVTYTDNFFELTRERFLLQSLNISLNYDGLMSITASNINNLPFVV